MLKHLRNTLLTLIVLALLLIAFFLFYRGNTSSLNSLSADTPEGDLIQRGEYLARLGDCIACHTNKQNPDSPAFAGGYAIRSPVGTIYSTNITPDKEHGIGRYTLQDFDNAVRFGIRKDGSSLYPAMPFASFSRITDEDIMALYVYFMQRIPPVAQDNKRNDIPWPLNMRWPLNAWRLFLAPSVQPFDPSHYDHPAVARGAYLVQGLGHCGMCHTPRSELTFAEQAYTDRDNHLYLSGSAIPMDGWIPVNLRNDLLTGIGQISESELAMLLRTGRNNHQAVLGGMADVVNESLQYMTEDDALAVAHYLKSLPPADPAGNKPFEYDPATANALASGDASARGARTYLDNCAACHRTDGRGYAQTFPALAGNTALQHSNPASAINIVLHGHTLQGTMAAPTAYTMPSLSWRLSDGQVADVVTFIRTSWGNRGGPVNTQQVSAYRATSPPSSVAAQQN